MKNKQGVWVWLCRGVGVVGRGKGSAQFKAVSEMPRPCVTVVLQATEHYLVANSSLTRRGSAPNKLLNLLEQLLHKIKANRRREMSLFYYLTRMRLNDGGYIYAGPHHICIYKHYVYINSFLCNLLEHSSSM